MYGMRIFINNVDGYLAGAICADLYKLSPNIIGTRKSDLADQLPPMVRKVIKRDGLRRLLKTIASCDVVVYDLHDADFEELELVLQTLYTSQIRPGMTFILVSSVGVWAKTQHRFELKELDEEAEEGSVVVPVGHVKTPEATPVHGSAVGDDAQLRFDQADAENEDEEEEEEDHETDEAESVRLPAKTVKTYFPMTSEEHIRRIPAPKFQEWKSLETLALGLASKNRVRPYVVCAGIPYGLGEEPFLGLFQAAWQSRDSLRVIGDGGNKIPLVHARDVARCVRLVLEVEPQLPYHLAVDRGQVTQRQLVDTVSSFFNGDAAEKEVPSVSVAEAVLAEFADILSLDLMMEPSCLITDFAPAVAAEDAGSAPPAVDVEPSEVASHDREPSVPMSPKKAKPVFKWWCEDGLVANVSTVAGEFCLWRQLDPVRIFILGPPGGGARPVAALVAEWYSLGTLVFERVAEDLCHRDVPFAKALRDALQHIDTGGGKDKKSHVAPGPPGFLPPTLAVQLPDAAVNAAAAPLRFRGFAFTGFPSTLDEAAGYFLRVEDGSEALIPERAPDVVVILSAREETCVAAQPKECPEMSADIFNKKKDKWKHDSLDTALADFFRQRCGIEPLLVDMDATTMEAAAEQVGRHLEEVRPVHLLPSRYSSEVERHDVQMEPPHHVDEEAARREAKERKKREEQEAHMQLIKIEEGIRLEKHSEPLRQYFQAFVVPSLTAGVIEVCRNQPSDPVGFLAEYLHQYSVAARQRRPRAHQDASLMSAEISRGPAEW